MASDVSEAAVGNCSANSSSRLNTPRYSAAFYFLYIRRFMFSIVRRDLQSKLFAYFKYYRIVLHVESTFFRWVVFHDTKYKTGHMDES